MELPYFMPSRVRRLVHSGTRKRRILLLLLLCAISTYVLQGAIFRTFNYLTCVYREERDRSEAVFQRELIQIQVLFRHGHRSPFSMYPNDPVPKSYWIDGLKHLTKLGRVQHYFVGQYLRKRYSNFLTHQPQEVHCLSSGASRCMFGAYSILAGMYPPPPNRLIDEHLHWQPIPVEFSREREDKYLQSTDNCPASDIEKKLMFKRPEGAAFIAKYQHLYEFWSNYSGQPVTDYDKAGGLYKTLLLQKTLNLTIPAWAEETWEDLSVQGDISYYFNFKSNITHRLRAGPLLEYMLDKMKMKMRDPESSKKVHLYSGHGSNVSAFLHSLLLYNMKMPPYTSFITLELYKYEGQRYSVRMLYNNATNPAIDIPKPNILVLPGCTEYCPFEYVEKSTLHLIPEDYEKECEIHTI